MRCALAALALAIVLSLSGASPAAADVWHVLENPIDPAQLTNLPYGDVSELLQPWRSTLTTRAAVSLQDAIGINLNVSPDEAAATAQLLHDSGFRRARLEVEWDAMSYADPSQLADPAQLVTYITAMRDNGIRPLILLNANSGDPGPSEALNLTLTAAAAQGATTVSLDGASAARVVPGLTGINTQLPYPMAAGVLITGVDANGVATLSQPLPTGLPAGSVAASTLRYAPFAPPYLANGTPNPRFEQTLSGWLTYVKTVTQFVRDTYGSANFDVEVWNELSLGSNFLDERNYFSPVPDPGSTGNIDAALLSRTIQMLRDPANGLTQVKVGDGFTNLTTVPSGASVPAGADAIDKHPYTWPADFPLATTNDRVFMPETPLTGIQTGTLMHDLGPIQATISSTPGGAGTHPTGGPPPAMWITEDNLDAAAAQGDGLPAADVPEFQAKAALRFFTSYASEGAQAIDLYAAQGGPSWQLIPQSFFDAVDANPASYPAGLGGLTMQTVGRLASTLAGAQNIAHARQLTLDAVAQNGNHAQYTGTYAGDPSLYDRDVLAFFPFQVSQHRFVSAVYVMTHDLTRYYTSTPAPGSTSYDMPPETFRLTIGNVHGAGATVSLTDPLTGTQQPSTIVSRDASHIVVALSATDSPRMLTIDDTPPAIQALTLTAPARASAGTVRRRGISIALGCGPPCVVQLEATVAGGRLNGHVFGRATAHLTARGIIRVTLRLSAGGRVWLGTRQAKRLRITAREHQGITISKVVELSHGFPAHAARAGRG